MNKVEKNPVIQDDILRYKKNKFSSSLVLIGIVCNCLYFMLFYGISDTTLYKLLVGLSVVVNLIVLLMSFYSSETIKNYKKAFAVVLLILAVVQIVRMFIYPLQVASLTPSQLHARETGDLKYVVYYFGVGLTPVACCAWLMVYLGISAACFIGAAVTGYITAVRLEKHIKGVESGEIDIDAILRETDALGGELPGQTKITQEVK